MSKSNLETLYQRFVKSFLYFCAQIKDTYNYDDSQRNT